jgi:hypothetical protein
MEQGCNEEGLDRGSSLADDHELSEEPLADQSCRETLTLGRVHEQRIGEVRPGATNLRDRRLKVYKLTQEILDTSMPFRMGQGAREVRLWWKWVRIQDVLQPLAALILGQEVVELFRPLAPDLSWEFGVEENQGELESLRRVSFPRETAHDLIAVHALENLKVQALTEEQMNLLRAAGDRLLRRMCVDRGQLRPLNEESGAGLR